MSMSTNISDLPGGNFQEEDQYQEEDQEEDQDQDFEDDIDEEDRHHGHHRHHHGHHGSHHLNRRPQYQNSRDFIETFDNQNVNMSVKKTKKVVEDASLFVLLKDEVNEENILLLVVLYLATTHFANDLTRRVLSLFNLGGGYLDITKTVLLFVLFIVVKHFGLPMLN